MASASFAEVTCSFIMCESQAYVLTVCPVEILLNPEFLETPSSWNKSSSKCMISTSPSNTYLFCSFYKILSFVFLFVLIHSE